MSSIITHGPVLITGGAGFIGANLARRLLDLGYEVNLILKDSTNIWRLENILSKLNIYKTNLLDREKLEEIIREIHPAIIFHLASYANYRDQKESIEMAEVNIKGTLNLLMATRHIDYKIFVNTGSSSEYGIKNTRMTESDMLQPVSFYGSTKASATLLSLAFAKEYKKPIVVLRPFSVYGTYEDKNRFIPTIIRSLIQGRSIKITSGRQRRDFIFIDDVVDIYLRTISKGKKLAGQILNMGTGKEHENDEVVKLLFKVAGKKVIVEKGAFAKRLWDNPHWVADISKAKKMLKWTPKYSLAEGLEKTYLWLKNAEI